MVGELHGFITSSIIPDKRHNAGRVSSGTFNAMSGAEETSAENPVGREERFEILRSKKY